MKAQTTQNHQSNLGKKKQRNCATWLQSRVIKRRGLGRKRYTAQWKRTEYPKITPFIAINWFSMKVLRTHWRKVDLIKKWSWAKGESHTKERSWIPISHQPRSEALILSLQRPLSYQEGVKMRLRNYYLDAEAGKNPSRQSTRPKTKPWFKVTANKNWETFVLMGWSLWMVVMLIPLRNPWKMHSLARKCAWTELKIQTVWVQTKYRGCLDCDSPIKGGAEDMGSRLIAKYIQIFTSRLFTSRWVSQPRRG